MRWLPVLALVSILLVSGCTSTATVRESEDDSYDYVVDVETRYEGPEITPIKAILDEPEAYVGKNVTVIGALYDNDIFRDELRFELDLDDQYNIRDEQGYRLWLKANERDDRVLRVGHDHIANGVIKSISFEVCDCESRTVKEGEEPPEWEGSILPPSEKTIREQCEREPQYLISYHSTRYYRCNPDSIETETTYFIETFQSG